MVMINNDLALIYGILLGDGCLCRSGKYHHIISIVGHIEDDYPFLNNIKPILEKIKGNVVKLRKRHSKGAIEINFSHKKTFFLFKDLGFPVGKKGINLKISNKFDENFYRYIIQGYFATDGCLVLTNNNGTLYPRIEFSSISKPLLKQVLEYLNKNGMKGALYISHKYENNHNTLYRIQFNGKKNLKTFIEKIGFVNPKHDRKFEYYKKICR